MEYLFDKGFIVTDKTGNSKFVKKKQENSIQPIGKKLNCRKKIANSTPKNSHLGIFSKAQNMNKTVDSTFKPKIQNTTTSKLVSKIKNTELDYSNMINLQKREHIRKSILHCMKKYYSQRNTNSLHEPEMALSKIDIQRLLSGYKEAVTPGFGSIDLFNNPQLRKKNKKLKSEDILSEVKEMNITFKSKRKIKDKIINAPLKFTFKIGDGESSEMSDLSRVTRGKAAFISPKNSVISPQNKGTFLTDNEYYDAEGQYHYRPIIRNPALDSIIERNKTMTKEQRIKKSKLLSQFIESSEEDPN